MIPPAPDPNYPKTGEYRGEPIDIDHAMRTLSPAELADVVVDVPGKGHIRPWRYAQATLEQDEDGAILLDFDDPPETADAGDWDEEAHPRVPAGQPGGGQFGAGGGTAAAKEAKPAGLARTHFASVTDAESRRAEVKDKIRILNSDLDSGEVSPESYVGYRKQLDDEMNAIGDQTFTPDQIVGGLHHDGMSKWLEKPENKPDLVVSAGGLGKGVGGQYRSPLQEENYDRGEIRVDANSYVDEKTPPAAGAAGYLWAASELDPTVGTPTKHTYYSALERVQSNFIHELGHHIHMGDSTAQVRDPAHLHDQFEIVDKTIQRAYDSHGFDKVVGNGDNAMPTYVHVMRDDHEVDNPAISRYAAKNAKEYFAETFLAYVQHPDVLKAHDPVGHAMVARVLRIRGIEKGP